MAFAVTSRHVGNSASTPAQTLATNSTTPAADSLLLVGMVAENSAHAINQVWQTPTGGSLSYTQVAESADVAWNLDANFSVSGAMYRAPVGGSPSAHTITVDAYSGTESAYYDVRACDITGHDAANPVVQFKAASQGKSAGSAETGTVVLDAVPTAGNLIVVYFGCGADASGAPASPTAGGGNTFTQLSTSTGPFTNGGLWYRIADGAESATITCSDLGQTIGNYAAVAIEIRAAAAVQQSWLMPRGGAPFPLPFMRQAVSFWPGVAGVQTEVTTGTGWLGLGAESTAKKVAVVSARCTAGLGSQAAAVKKTPVAATSPVGLGSQVTARKAAAAASVAAVGLTGLATARKAAPAAGVSTLGLAATSTPKKAATPALRATLGLTGLATVKKSATPSLSAALGLFSTVTGKKVSTPALRSALGLAGLVSAKKISTPAALAALGLASTASRADIRAVAVTATLGLAGLVSAKKVTPAALSAPVGLATIGSTRKVTPAAARSAAGLAGLASTQKRATVSGLAPFGLSAWGLRGARAVTATACAGLTGISTAKKVSTPPARSTLGLAAATSATKKSAVTGRLVVGVVVAATAGKRQAVTGRATVGVTSWLVFFLVPPANDGYATIGTALLGPQAMSGTANPATDYYIGGYGGGYDDGYPSGAGAGAAAVGTSPLVAAAISGTAASTNAAAVSGTANHGALAGAGVP